MREAGEAEAGHIPGATSLPRRLIEFRIAELVPHRRTPIVLYDGGGETPYGPDRRAALAAATLAGLGYRDLRCLEGGLAAWRAVGDVATGTNVPCKHFGERILEEERIPYVTPDGLAARLAAGERPAICDVRTVEEFAGHHLPGARATPGFDLALHLPGLKAENGSVVVNCAGRTRSIIATATARLLGFDDVVALENGTMGWRLAGHPVETGAGPAGAVPPAHGETTERARALALSVGATETDAATLADRLDGADIPHVFDVRSLDDFRRGHVPGAVALPGGQAVQRADDFAAVPGAAIVFVDGGDARAFLAAYWYRRMGFPRVSVLQDGMPAWLAQGLPAERERRRAVEQALAPLRAAVATVDAADLRRRLRGGHDLRLVDVGTSRHFAAGHVPGATWLPRGWLEDGIGNVARPEDDIVVTARDERQALLAAATLRDLGHAHVRILSGGTAAWAALGEALATGLDGLAAAPGDVVDAPYDKGEAAMRRYLDWEVGLLRPADQGRGTGGTTFRS